MRKLLMLLAMGLAALAVMTSSAFATPMPHENADVSRWADVYVDSGWWQTTDCSTIDCTFTGTSSDFALTIHRPTGPEVLSCDSLTLDYELDVNQSLIDDFDVVGASGQGANCVPGGVAPERGLTVCAYSPSDWASFEDIEFWVRDPYLQSSNGYAVFGRLTGSRETEDPNSTRIDVDGIEFDDAPYGVDPHSGYLHTVDGTVDFDAVLPLSVRFTQCGFPEIL